MTIAIEQIRGRAEQGITHPFLCCAEDGNWYYVKGRGAGLRSLICEWIVGRLARAFGLPVPPFAQVEVPQSLIITALRPDLSELGAGIAFGSMRQDLVQELSVSHLDLIPDDVQSDVLMFDWWVHNQDRTLTANGGNPNLLWDPRGEALVVIDHNQTFDRAFDASSFYEQHAFAGQATRIAGDLVERARYCDRFEALLPVFDQACAEIPDEWWFVDDGVAVDFDREVARRVIARFQKSDFWEGL